MQQQQGVQIDLSDTEMIVHNERGYLHPAVIQRTVSKFITGSPEDSKISINVLIDPVSKKIVKDSIPEPIREDYDDFSIDLD